MLRPIALAAALVLLPLPVAGRDREAEPVVGRPAPALAGTTVDGGRWSSKDHYGRGLTVVWFLPREGLSAEEFAKAVEPRAFAHGLARRHPLRGHLRCVGVLRWEEPLGGVDPDFRLPLPVFEDPDREIARAWGEPPEGALTAFVVEPDSRVSKRIANEDGKAAVREAREYVERRTEEIPAERAAGVARALEAKLAALDLEPAARVTRDGDRFRASWRVREYEVYGRSFGGRWSEKLRKRTGPEHDGLLVGAWIDWGMPPTPVVWAPVEFSAERDGNSMREPYWNRVLMRESIPGSPLTLYVRLDHGTRTDRRLIERVVDLVRAAAGLD